MKALLPLFALLAWTVPARAEDTPLVWAFRHFCADEAFTLDEARLAVAVAGGKQRQPAAKLSNTLSITVWDIVIQGRKLSVSLGGQRVPAGPGGAMDTVSCAITADSRDDAGIASLRRWAAIAPDTNAATGLTVYRFVSREGKHIPVPGGPGGDADRLWQLYVLGGALPNVTVTRFFKVRAHS